MEPSLRLILAYKGIEPDIWVTENLSMALRLGAHLDQTNAHVNLVCIFYIKTSHFVGPGALSRFVAFSSGWCSQSLSPRLYQKVTRGYFWVAIWLCVGLQDIHFKNSLLCGKRWQIWGRLLIGDSRRSRVSWCILLLLLVFLWCRFNHFVYKLFCL